MVWYSSYSTCSNFNTFRIDTTNKNMASIKKLFKVIDTSSTKHLPTPLKENEIVEQVEDDSVEEGYIKVKHSGAVSVFLRNRFKRHIEKAK